MKSISYQIGTRFQGRDWDITTHGSKDRYFHIDSIYQKRIVKRARQQARDEISWVLMQTRNGAPDLLGDGIAERNIIAVTIHEATL